MEEDAGYRRDKNVKICWISKGQERENMLDMGEDAGMEGTRT